MIIACTYDKATGEVFQHFGKTQHFKIYEFESNEITNAVIVDNGGFGHHDLVPYLKSLGVETLILGNRGQGAIDALRNGGIKEVPGVTGNADEAALSFMRGTLVGNPNAKCNHHGAHEHAPVIQL